MVHVIYVGPHDEVEVFETGQVVRRGESIEVSAELAGRAPTAQKGEPGEKGYQPADLGAGLLAQPANWAKPNTKAAKSAPPPDAPPEPEPTTVDGQPIDADEETA